MALLVYLGVLLALAFRYSYLLFAPEPVPLPELNAEQLEFIAQQMVHKRVYFSALSALCLLGWSLNIRSLVKPLKTLVSAFCGLLTMFLVNDLVFSGEFSLIDHISTIIFLGYAAFMVYPVTHSKTIRHARREEKR